MPCPSLPYICLLVAGIKWNLMVSLCCFHLYVGIALFCRFLLAALWLCLQVLGLAVELGWGRHSFRYPPSISLHPLLPSTTWLHLDAGCHIAVECGAGSLVHFTILYPLPAGSSRHAGWLLKYVEIPVILHQVGGGIGINLGPSGRHLAPRRNPEVLLN
jgi:hypothetical protein